MGAVSHWPGVFGRFQLQRTERGMVFDHPATLAPNPPLWASDFPQELCPVASAFFRDFVPFS